MKRTLFIFALVSMIFFLGCSNNIEYDDKNEIISEEEIILDNSFSSRKIVPFIIHAEKQPNKDSGNQGETSKPSKPHHSGRHGRHNR